MRFRSTVRRCLISVSVLAVALTAAPGRAARIPVASFPPGFTLPRSDIVFQSRMPLADIAPGEWTERQRGEIAYFREQMRKRDEIFLLVRVTLDAIGRKDENEGLANEVAQAVAVRLRDAGIPPDRMLILPGREDRASLDGPRLSGFARHQVVEITGLLGGDWLRRKPPQELHRAVDLPPPSGISILEPSGAGTDRANHMLRGTTDPSVGSLAVTIGQDARTVAVRDGRFETPISLRSGENPIVVTGLDPFGRVLRASRTVRYTPPHPTIEILSPAEGTVTDVSRSPVISVRGAIRSRTPLKEAFLIQNDIPRNIPVREDGTFHQQAILMTETDTFQVEAIDTAGETGTSGVRKAPSRGIADRPLMAILHWDEDDVDLDLHVVDGSDHHTYFDAADALDNLSAVPEGKLWIDNRRGFGPEVFTMERTVPGEYAFSVRRYRGKKRCRAFLTLVLFAGAPSRKLVRVYGPVELSEESPAAEIVRVSLPSGIVR
ncbi:MAG: hypothetical protein C4529_08445 [Deltaproteobacteria bacterium]|nr:MAG: hypothetical protein C4529_08445 [Deltaproteobacteria bacterium]